MDALTRLKNLAVVERWCFRGSRFFCWFVGTYVTYMLKNYAVYMYLYAVSRSNLFSST
jgi:hypothetical protein